MHVLVRLLTRRQTASGLPRRLLEPKAVGRARGILHTRRLRDGALRQRDAGQDARAVCRSRLPECAPVARLLHCVHGRVGCKQHCVAAQTRRGEWSPSRRSRVRQRIGRQVCDCGEARSRRVRSWPHSLASNGLGHLAGWHTATTARHWPQRSAGHGVDQVDARCGASA